MEGSVEIAELLDGCILDAVGPSVLNVRRLYAVALAGTEVLAGNKV